MYKVPNFAYQLHEVRCHFHFERQVGRINRPVALSSSVPQTKKRFARWYFSVCSCFQCVFGLCVKFPNLWGASPLCSNLLHNIWFRSSGCASFECGADVLRCSPRGRYNETSGLGCCEEEEQPTIRPTKVTIIEATC